MNNTMFMGRRQTFCELHSQTDNFLLGKRTGGQLLAECDSGDVLHHQEVNTPLIVEIVDGCNVWMIQFGKRQGLFVEMLAGTFIGDGASVQNFDGDFAAEVIVMGSENHTHPAAADFFDDAVVGELEPDE